MKIVLKSSVIIKIAQYLKIINNNFNLRENCNRHARTKNKLI